MSDGSDLDAWLRELCAALGLPEELTAHRALILDVARDAAHGVARPAAPLTTFLVGYAAGLAGDAADAVTRAAALATQHAAERGQ